MTAENRRHERRALAVTFQARDAHGAGQLVFESADLSAGGTFLRSDLLLEQGETLSLEFSLPGARLMIRAQARVAWVRRFPEDGEPAGMGVEFTLMQDSDRAALSKHLQT